MTLMPSPLEVQRGSPRDLCLRPPADPSCAQVHNGTWCAEGVTNLSSCDDGCFIPEGSSVQAQCPACSYCDRTQCPTGSRCVAGSTAATACLASANCPAGSTSNPQRIKVELTTTLSMGVAEFVASYRDAFRAAAVGSWLGAAVSAQDVVINHLLV